MVPDSSPRRPAFFTFLRFIHDRNPFYLLSALSMFIGFRVILGAMDSRPGDWKTLLGLIITLNLYEVVMIALALFLIVRRGFERDGWILLGIEALFLVDLTNLNAELFTAMPRLGSVVNSICFLLAMAKILIIVRALGLRLAAGTTFYIAAQLAFLFGVPGIFRLMRSSTATITSLQIYSIWWIAGLLIASGALLAKREPANNRSSMAALPWRLYVLMPLVSLLVHLASENRVYWIHFQPANLAPVLLATCFALNQTRWRFSRNAIQTSLTLIGFAVLISIVPDMYQADLTGRISAIDVTPLRITLLASAALTIYLTILHHSLIFAQAAVAGLALAKLGSNPQEMLRRLVRMMSWCYDLLMQLTPQTDMEWGMTAVGSAFLLLAIGAVISLRKVTPAPFT